MFYSEPCKTVHNELVLAAESLSKTSDVSIYEVDCSEHEKFCASFDVLSFPTIRVFEHQKWSRYRGPQRATPYDLFQVLDDFTVTNLC